MAIGGLAFSWIASAFMPNIVSFMVASMSITVVGTGLGVLLMQYMPHPDADIAPKVLPLPSS
jgi:hypothetical protein